MSYSTFISHYSYFSDRRRVAKQTEVYATVEFTRWYPLMCYSRSLGRFDSFFSDKMLKYFIGIGRLTACYKITVSCYLVVGCWFSLKGRSSGPSSVSDINILKEVRIRRF